MLERITESELERLRKSVDQRMAFAAEALMHVQSAPAHDLPCTMCEVAVRFCAG
jgi:hypothetical protein